MPKAAPKSAKKPKRVPSPQGPAAAYGKAVAKHIAKQSRDSTYRPEKPLTLKVQNARMPASVEELGPEERVQLRAVFGKRLERALGSEETQLEAAEVIDETGAIRYRLYGANFGEGYLFPAESPHRLGRERDARLPRTQKRPSAPTPTPAPNETGRTLTFAARERSSTVTVSGMISEPSIMRALAPCTTPLVTIIAFAMSSLGPHGCSLQSR